MIVTEISIFLFIIFVLILPFFIELFFGSLKMLLETLKELLKAWRELEKELNEKGENNADN